MAPVQPGTRNDRVSSEYRPDKPRLPGGDRSYRAVPRGGHPLDVCAAFLSAPAGSADPRYRLFLASRGRIDDVVLGHGAGIAVLYGFRPFLGRGYGGDSGRAVGDARTGTGPCRTYGRRPHRRLDGGRDRHHAGDGPDRRAGYAFHPPDAVSGRAAHCGRDHLPSVPCTGRRPARRLRRVPCRCLPAGVQPVRLSQPHAGVP